MDPLQSKEIFDSENSNNTTFTTTTDGELSIQLEGGHTTSTETESVLFSDQNQKNVKFQGRHKNEQSKDTMKIRKKHEQHECDKEENLNVVRITKDVYVKDAAAMQHKTAAQCSDNKKMDEEVVSSHHAKMQNITKERNEIFHRLEQIIDKFESLSKNFETLDVKEKSINKNKKIIKNDSVKGQQSEAEEIESRCFKEPSNEDNKKSDIQDRENLLNLAESTTTPSCSAELDHLASFVKQQKMVLKDIENEAKEALKATQGRSISAATSSCEVKSFGCQTQFSEYISLNTLDLMDVSSLGSRSEQQNSLNNFAQPENACSPYYGSQQDIIKQSLIQQQPATSPAIIIQPQTSETPQFNVITIETSPRPSSTDLRRPPFWQRLWEVIGDFCAATILCLQVNKDCIFCLGFIVAFVVSASFLTAFFYHTIILSPTLWLTDESPQF